MGREQLGAKILDLDIGPINIESRVCDLPPEGSNKSNLIDALASLNWVNFQWAK